MYSENVEHSFVKYYFSPHHRSKAVLITGCDSGFGFSLAAHAHNVLDVTVVATCFCPDGDQTGADELKRITGGSEGFNIYFGVGKTCINEQEVVTVPKMEKKYCHLFPVSFFVLCKNFYHLW